MVIQSPDVPPDRAGAELRTVQPDSAGRYGMYGLRIQSDVRLPLPCLDSADDDSPDCIFRRSHPGCAIPEPTGQPVTEVRCYGACHRGTVVIQAHRGDIGTRIWHESAGVFWISPDVRRVDVYSEVVDERTLALALAGMVSIVVLQQRGHPSLHASAVVTHHGAVAFLGSHGQGKSTMAASFLRRGATLLTDDALPLRVEQSGILAGPGLPIMKLWPAAAERTLRLPEKLPPLMANSDKRLLSLGKPYQFAGKPTSLRAIYVLDRFNPTTAGGAQVSFSPIHRRQAATALLAQTSWGSFLVPEQQASVLALYSRLSANVPMFNLGYPHGYQYQDDVYARIDEHLATAT